jgi:hypothetical protein
MQNGEVSVSPIPASILYHAKPYLFKSSPLSLNHDPLLTNNENFFEPLSQSESALDDGFSFSITDADPEKAGETNHISRFG